MSAPAAAGTLAAQSGGTPSPQRHQQLGGSHPHTPPLMRVTAQEARKPEGDDETLAPAHPISRAGPEVSEDEGEGGSGSSGKKKKKQRSMAELIKGLDLNLGDDGGMGEEGIEEAAPAKGEEEAATTPTTAAVAEVEAPPSPTTAAARKRKKDGEGDSESEAKGSPASPPTADPEANQAPVLPDGGVSSGRRERKKSKYLSPPYTMVIEKKPSFSSRSASGDALDLDGLGGVSSPLAKCSSFGRKKEAVDLELPFVFDESTPSVAELLAELRCASVGVMYLVASRHGSAVRGCFTLFRTYSYTGTGITGGNKAPVEETKPSVPAPVLPIAADNKALQQQDNGGDTNNLIKTPAENKNPEEANKSASGKRSYNKKKTAPAVVATTTEANGGVEEPKTRGRPKKKNKEKEDKSSALDNDGYGASTPTPPSAPAPAASNNTPAAAPAPAPTPNNNTPAAAPAPAPAPSNNTVAAAPAPAPALNNNTPAAAPAPAPAPSNDIPAAAPAPVVTQLQANGGSSAAVVPEQDEAKKKKKRKRRSGPPGSASLILTFTPGADLPTKDHLLGFFSRYGVLDEARTEVRAATRVACVAYAVKADAQRAIASPDRDQAFGPGVATFRIKYARQARQPGGAVEGEPVSPAAAGVVMPTRAIPRLPLEFVKKNLESMIAALELCRPEGAGSGVPATGSEVETDPRNELVDQMSNLLTKVNKLLADGSASGSLANGGVDATAAAASSTTAAAGGLTA